MSRPLTNLEIRFAELWNDGVKAEVIADEMNLALSTVHDWRVRLCLLPRSTSPRKYNDDQIALLKKLWCEEGLSSSEIAKRMGPGWSRNTVIGQATRRGFTKLGRQAASAPVKMVREPKAPKVKAAPKSLPPKPGQQGKVAVVLGSTFPPCSPEEADKKRAVFAAEGRTMIDRVAEVANDNAIPLLSRRFGQCAWPVGAPGRPAEQMVCGADVFEGIETCPYCFKHAQRAYVRDITKPRPKEDLVRANRRWAA